MITNAKIVGTGIDPQVYHRVYEKRGDLNHPVSPSMLKNFAQCPSRFIAGYDSPDSEAKDWGNLLDTVILTPDLFGERYVIRPAVYTEQVMECPQCGSRTDSQKCRKCGVDRVKTSVEKDWNSNSSVCAEWLEQKIMAGFEIISPKEHAQAAAARDRLLNFEPDADFPIKRFIEASDKQVLVVAEWHDDETGLVIPLRCLIDLAPREDTEFAKCLGDLKTTRCAAVMPFQRDAFKMRYHVQAAFDLDLYRAATAQDRNTWCLVVQESFEPWQPGKRIMSDMPDVPGNFIGLGRATYLKWLKNYCRCLKSGKWPAYDDNDEAAQGWTPLSAEPWMENELAFSPNFDAEPPAAPTSDPDDLIP